MSGRRDQQQRIDATSELRNVSLTGCLLRVRIPHSFMHLRHPSRPLLRELQRQQRQERKENPEYVSPCPPSRVPCLLTSWCVPQLHSPRDEERRKEMEMFGADFMAAPGR